MSGYILILVWIAFIAIVPYYMNVNQIELVSGKKVYRCQPVWAVIVVLPLVIWAGYRELFADTASYANTFKKMPTDYSAISSYMDSIDKDEGFYFLSSVIKCIIGNHVELYFFIIAAVQAFLIFRIYRKYSVQFAFSFFLFIVSTDYISWMFNGMRQFLATTIVFGCFELIMKKKYILTIIIIMLASTIHGSALIMIPFIFIVQGKAWNKKTLLFAILSILAVVFIGEFTDILDTALQDTQYTYVVSDWQAWQDDGTNPLRVLVYSVPAILSWLGIKEIREADDPVINICTNMSIISAAFYIVSMFTSGIYIGRLPIYFSLSSYILLPWLIEKVFSYKWTRWIYVICIALYLVFYYYQVHFTWGLI